MGQRGMIRRSSRLNLFLLTVWALLLTFPLVWMFYTAFLKPDKIMSGSLSAATSLSDFSLENIKSLFEQATIFTWIGNSLIVALSVTFISLFFNSLAGYVFARREFPGKEAFFWLILATMMIPGQVIVVPLYILMCRMNLVDTLYAVILPALTSPFGIFMMRTHMASIPRDLEDAARIDGASEFGIYRHVIIPMSLPVLGTLGIFTFMTYWNAFLWPLIVLYDARRYTLSVGLATLQGQHVQDYGLLMSGAAVASIPMLIVFFLFARVFTKGLMAGGVKD
jgi:multiple sugar transport system permease protein